MKSALYLSVIACLGVPSISRAADIHAVGFVEGYTCMMLDIPREKMMDFKNPPTFKTAPADDAPNGFILTPQVAVKDNSPSVNGYLEAIQSNGAKAWIKKSEVVPFAMPEMPNMKCYVAKMSTGAIGFIHR